MHTDKQILKLAQGRFRITTLNVPNSQLFLDFNPIIKFFKLTGNFSLIHWQARPKKYRQWGIYNSQSDSYQSVAGFQMKGIFTSLQIPDEQAISLPSAVIHINHQ